MKEFLLLGLVCNEDEDEENDKEIFRFKSIAHILLTCAKKECQLSIYNIVFIYFYFFIYL
jgi:hypothetical protein